MKIRASVASSVHPWLIRENPCHPWLHPIIRAHPCIRGSILIPIFTKKTTMGISDILAQQKAEKSAANLQAGQDFLTTNALRETVISLPSGLQYEIITQGTGEKPLATNQVTCHYHGTLIDGTIFDSSVQRGQPATFPLSAVIKGWTEGLQLMPSGSKWRFFIPPHLGYGDRQVSAQIGPNSTLVFEVELISFR